MKFGLKNPSLLVLKGARDAPGSSDPVPIAGNRGGVPRSSDPYRHGMRENDFHPQAFDIHCHFKCKFVRCMLASRNDHVSIKKGPGTGLVLVRERFSSISIRSKPNSRFQALCFSCISKRRICPRRCVAASSATRIVSQRRQIVASTSSDILAKLGSSTVLFKNRIKNAVLAFT